MRVDPNKGNMMTRYVTYGDGNETVVGRIDDYLDAEDRRNPAEVSRHDTDEEAIKEMRRLNAKAS